MQFLSEYGLFLAKMLTLAFVLVLTLAALIAVAQRAKRDGDDTTLSITPINEKFEDLAQSLQSETLDKNAYKQWHKAEQKKRKELKKDEVRPRLFVMHFDGDMKASQTDGLREMISAILSIATPHDEVLVILESAGGYVQNYGLAASQLNRIKAHQIKLTVAIDACAASGGYLMAVVAHEIVAAPFAIIGSIGVVGQLPNFHKLLQKNHVDFEIHTAGEFKRTLTVFGENTEKGRQKFQEEIEETHRLFKEYITHHRPQVDINHVATGEHWHGIDALSKQLVDSLKTSDDFIMERLASWDIFELSYEEKPSLIDKITHAIFARIEKTMIRWFSRTVT